MGCPRLPRAGRRRVHVFDPRRVDGGPGGRLVRPGPATEASLARPPPGRPAGRAGMTVRDEILEQPRAAERLLATQAAPGGPIDGLAAAIRDLDIEHVVIAARGSSD